MRKFLCGAIAAFTLLAGCNNPNPAGNAINSSVAPNDTSILLGKWVQIFDTSSQSGWGYWCSNDPFFHCSRPDTITFINDSMLAEKSMAGEDIRYWYGPETLYTYVKTGFITESDTNKLWYRMNHDTLFIDDTSHIARYIKTSR